MKVKVPLVRKFIFEGVSTLTSERYFKEAPRFAQIGCVLGYINKLILKNRHFMFKDHDIKLNNILNKFYENRHLFEDIKSLDDSIILKTTKLPIKNVLITSSPGEELILDFDTLTRIINERVYDDLKGIEDEIVYLIQDTKIAA